MQQGEHVAKNIQHILKGEPTENFTYVDRGTVASLGKHDGVGLVYGREITGKKKQPS